MILKETKTPAGYRSVGEIGLYFYETKAKEVLLLSNSVWDEGAYAMPKVTAVAPNTIRLVDGKGTVTLTGYNAVDNPVMFAVVFQKQDEDTWYPVSGDPLNGWEVHSDSSWDSVLSAAQANPYVFQLASSGAYQVEISNLPGDIKTYYHLCQSVEDARYTVAYYYTTANSISGATESNTTRIDSEATGQYAMNRVFSANLYVTNIKNRFFVQKVDQNGNPVNGAVFFLYQAKDVTVANGAVTVKPGATPYDSVTTSDLTDIIRMNGGGVFPSPGKVLEFGEYYLIETSPPAGYQGNANAIHVIADQTGVYIDAGTEGDGISVLRGAGSVMRSMVQFASDDKVDTTLREIKATLASSVTFNGYNKDGSFTVGEGSWDVMDNVLHLQFANAHQVLDYGLYDGTEGTIDNLTKRTETGWSKLLIRQCFAHNGDVNADLKEDLGDQDITNLFSGTVTVRVSNHKMGGLTISKTVTGDLGNRDTEFQFTVKLMKEDGSPLSGTYRYTGGVLPGVTGVSAPADGTLTLGADGKATFTLKHGQYISIQDQGLLTGYQYEVTEAETQQMGYTTQYAIDNGEKTTGNVAGGTLPETGGAQVSFENSRNYVPPTGIYTGIQPWLLLMGIALAGGTVLLLNGRLRSNRKYGGRHAR